MALWTTHQNLSHDLNTALVLLTDALNSALNDALFFERAACRKPEMKGAGHAEIAARLTRFRESGNEFRAREALMLTKINRARKWAAELRRLAPEMQDDVDQFLDATEDCDKFLSEFSHDA